MGVGRPPELGHDTCSKMHTGQPWPPPGHTTRRPRRAPEKLPRECGPLEAGPTAGNTCARARGTGAALGR
eukprot:11223751-Lingulodinium_polyedra.AAC.1